jgi:SAM-dependent methyltransferase
MTDDEPILELGSWLRTPPGRCVLDWEQRCLDRAVNDAFGWHAVQLGLPELDALRANRMPHRWIAQPFVHQPEPIERPEPDAAIATIAPPVGTALLCDFEALPFPEASLDLLVLPHTLEFAHDAHATLRECERVLRPEGRLLVTGFNPASLWGLRQRTGRMRRGGGQGLYLPRGGGFIGYWRLRDWMRLLGLEIDAGRFGCWRPPAHSQRWLDRFAWVEPIGERWWPVFGAAYFLSAVKRVRGMRLVGVVKRERRRAATAPAVAVNRRPVIETAEIE